MCFCRAHVHEYSEKIYLFYFIMHTYKSSIHKSYVFSFSHVPFKPTCQFFQSQSNQQNQVEYEWESVKRWFKSSFEMLSS